MTLHENAISAAEPDSSAVIDQSAANEQSAANVQSDTNEQNAASVIDNGINLASIFEPYFRPEANTIVCGALDEAKVAALAAAGVELVINLQPDDELSFDERAAVEGAGMAYEQLPISGANDLKQLKILAFDNILRQYHGKKIVMHCGSGNRAGAACARHTARN